MKDHSEMTPDGYADGTHLRISEFLNRSILGFAEGSSDGLRHSVRDRLRSIWGMEVALENIKVVIDDLRDPPRRCWSLHVEHGGRHYESVIRNMGYDAGDDL